MRLNFSIKVRSQNSNDCSAQGEPNVIKIYFSCKQNVLKGLINQFVPILTRGIYFAKYYGGGGGGEEKLLRGKK